MLNRFLGNKKQVLPEILDTIGNFARKGDLVCDIFSGTLAVTLALKRAGYRVASNDINYFSFAYGRAFLTNEGLPKLPTTALIDDGSVESRIAQARRRLRSSDNWMAQLPDGSSASRAAYTDLMAVLDFLESADEKVVAGSNARTDIFDFYCEAGAKSGFESSRGRVGRRRFFSPDNARRLDAILNRLRAWRQHEMIDEQAEATILAAFLDGVERISNTQGTYHDFPRDSYDPRSLNEFRFVLPEFRGLCGALSGHILGVAADSLNFIRQVPAHQVLYVDPPYNFRQYTAYYFMPNMLARYPRIPDLDTYFNNLAFVRGQNMDDDFSSPFSKPRLFVEALEDLFLSANASTIVLSYFNGRNHFNNSAKADSGTGLAEIEKLFSRVGYGMNFGVIPVSRLNYQSYGGHKARKVDELICFGSKISDLKSSDAWVA